MAALVIGAPVMWWQSRQNTGDSFRVAMERTVASKAINEPALPSLPAQSAPGAQPELDKTLADSASTIAAGESSNDAIKSLDLAKEAEGNSSALKKFAEVAIAPPSRPAGTESLGADEKSRAELRARLLAEQKGHLASGASKVDQAPAAPKTSEEFAKETSRPVIADSGSLGQKQKTENFRQQFSQTSANQAFRRDVKLQQAANVLNNFQVEQDGRQIRVVDADGSTYTGKIERLSQSDTRNLSKEKQNYAARSARAAAAAPTKDTDGSTSDEFYFHATGYSGSLKKSLIFEGNYIVTASPRQKASDDLTSKSGEEMPARIVGTAKIHGEPPVPVDAVSVSAK